LGNSFHDRQDFVPVVISDQIIDIYNASVAPSLGTPRLTSQTLNGFQFDIVFGRSLMLGSRGARRAGQEPAQIVGASRYAMRLGVTVPIETARRLLATYGDSEEDERYASILLRVRSPTFVPDVAEAVQAAGLAVDETAKRTSDILTGATLLASLVGVLVLMLAALNIAHTFIASLTERRRELAILRAVGARRMDLVLLVLVQAALMGLAGGLLGLVLGRAGGWLLNWGAHALLGELPFTPTVLMPAWLAGLSLAAAVVASVLGALWPAVRAARAPLARVLGEV
ncbi:MAG: FtsX-like permease family protein, partial [Deltaproteobacteria bacterium]|nr:FtsX-like permease family protein [Deltaproteobacteria bacterium]